MLGLTNLGIIHTAISLVALFSGLTSLIRYQNISSRNQTGKLYIFTTVLTCLTGFGIYQHGGFGAPHVLGIITLVVLGIAAGAERLSWFGSAARYVAVISYSATFLFHWIPTITETSTRLPIGAPLITNRDGPELQTASGILFLLFIIGATLQSLKLRAQTKAA